MRRAYGMMLSIFMLAMVLAVPQQAVAADDQEIQGSALRYTAIGDSIGFGFGGILGYVPRYQYYISIDNKKWVIVHNESVGGWKSDQLLKALQNDSGMRKNIARADVLTYEIGGNDMRAARNKYIKGTCGGADNQDCMRDTVARLKDEWVQITDIIIELRNGDTSNFKTMNLYNPYVKEDKKAKSHDGTKSRFEVFKPYLDEFNQFIEEKQSMGYLMADVYTEFNGDSHEEDPVQAGYIFIDGLHPNDKGYKKIAQTFRKLGYDEF
ncbi:hypothetical protein IC620_09110 [Hazenella sp. IB182357]|uniref:SGNH hydrolase-type esterase domain-containing protein n=1 Tax=Polycladospora coralii TaxID=2771432 RepID=A0A926RXH0_9BACL|nr:SGNH/GDSL hydrolase family protein [Polycladospora coralii]MBD1372511.1 hypothetical protein [Polycladospora coralii]MBS7531366.1 hypothetical protein [Polycladospora coralii]